MDMTCKPKNINELCHVERAVSDKTYKAGTCFVKLSAVDEFVGQLQHPDIIDSRYAALEPKDDTLNNKYLFLSYTAYPIRDGFCDDKSSLRMYSCKELCTGTFSHIVETSAYILFLQSH